MRSIDPRSESDPPGSRPRDEAESAAAWELIDTGRYMPRRVRGSFPGRELG